MLQFMGTRQAPRKYPVSGTKIARSQSAGSCDHCLTHVWTPGLITTLLNAPPGQESVSVSYETTSHALRQSAIEGCGFCRTLADGVSGSVFLNEQFDIFQATRSSDDSVSTAVTEESENVDRVERRAIDDERNDAETFNEDDDCDESVGAWDPWQDRDVLEDLCGLTIGLYFERGEEQIFSFLNASIQVAGADLGSSTGLGRLSGERAVELRYYLHDGGSPHINKTSIFPLMAANRKLGDEFNLQMIEKWASGLPFPTSAANTSKLQIPARLIDLHDASSLRIVETSRLSEPNPRYVALSYVWGPQQTFVLLSSNYEELQSGFEVDRLPQTIQDAIVITRQIGFKYIWVDALCIVQDADIDKAQELPKMRTIYKYAEVTIVAAVAQSAKAGFLHHFDTDPAYFIEPVTIPLHSADHTNGVVLSYPADYKRWKDPINSRAWTFQEFILSTRIIQFSYRGVETIDRTNIPNAAGLTSGKDPQLPNLGWSGKMLSLATDPENTRQIWLSLRGEYSRRSLSYQGDKLLAIAAVAEEVGRTYQSRYLAGLWERDLAMDLQWTCSPLWNGGGKVARKPRSLDFVAPSWSWASVDTAIEDFDVVAEGQGDDGGIGFKDLFGFEILSCDMELSDPSFEYGAVTSGVLVVKGQICTRIWQPLGDGDFDSLEQSDGSLVRQQDSDVQLEAPYEDTAVLDAFDTELIDGILVTCLATRRIENTRGRDDIEGLMLLPVDSRRYRRVGFFTFRNSGSKAGFRPEVVTIV